MAMSSGKADAQKLYFGGKLKISGNVMASQKLSFLKDVDRSKKASVSSDAPKTSSAREPAAAKIFGKLGEHAELIAELGAKIQFKISEPDARYVIDPAKKSVTSGEAKDAATTITIGDADLEALVRGEGAQSLFQRGKLRVDGDVNAARKLDLFKKLA